MAGYSAVKAGSKSAAGKKLNVTVVSDVSNYNNCVNQQLLIELAKDPRLKVTGFVPGHTEKHSKHARNLNIELVDADDLHGFSETELLSYPPDSLQIDIFLIHAYGPGLGKHAQVIRKNKKCKWAQVVHMISEELLTFSENPENCKHDHKMKIALCEKADVIIAIGPKVADAYRRALRVSRNDEKVIELTPGVIEELSGIRQVHEDDVKFSVLVSGSSHFFKVKGCDIAASAIKLLDMSYHLIVVVGSGESSEKKAEIRQALLNQGIDNRQLTVRVCESHLDWRRWLCEVDLVIKPSRTEGYGMSGLLAISANLPVLVSAYCGLGVVLKHLRTGANCVVESDDAQVWADKIKEIRENSPRNRWLQAERLKEEYMNNFNWTEQCEELVKNFFTMIQCKDDDTGENAQCMGSHGSVDSITRNVESIGLVSQTQNGRSCDVVDGGVKPDLEQVTKRLSLKVTELPLTVYSIVCVKLNVERNLRFDDFRMLAQKVGLTRDETDVIHQKCPNDTDEILRTWSTRQEATVGKLIELLKEKDFDRQDVVQILQDWVNER
ncbi:uncharacterized protein [Montipora capricornis]|uniref:uncharacterized protein n=1 Tax=Montipora capricornis TaxID=246305 RepID=UPI0035F13BD0